MDTAKPRIVAKANFPNNYQAYYFKQLPGTNLLFKRVAKPEWDAHKQLFQQLEPAQQGNKPPEKGMPLIFQ